MSEPSDGSDLDGIASVLEARFGELVERSDWILERPCVVNQRDDDDHSLEHAKTGREFVIGIAEPSSGLAEDLVYITSGRPDLDELRAALGAR